MTLAIILASVVVAGKAAPEARPGKRPAWTLYKQEKHIELKEIANNTEMGEAAYSFVLNGKNYTCRHEAYPSENADDGDEGSFDDLAEIYDGDTIVWSREGYTPADEAIEEWQESKS
ncbi:MAG: hypothetical protein HOO04_06775 [Phycisphaerae bacterium]|jgi:hypothetical protein|nr:hypothetical protein [Phycisphaerae bacterium]